MRAVNLLPVDERAGARAVATGRLNPLHAIAGVGAVVIVVLLGMWAMARHDASTAREAEAAATARTATAQAQVSRLQPVVALDRRRESRETAVVALAQGRTDWAMVLQSVAGALPRQVGITQLSAQAVGATASGSGGTVPAGLGGQGSVAINGCADTQRRVARTLVALRRLPQVADVALNQTSDGSKGASASSASSGAASGGCRKVTMDAALGLAPTTTLDLVPTAATATAAGGATGTTPNGTTSTPDNATQAAAGGTNGAGR